MMLLASHRYFLSTSKQKVDGYSAKSDVVWMYDERNFCRKMCDRNDL